MVTRVLLSRSAEGTGRGRWRSEAVSGGTKPEIGLSTFTRVLSLVQSLFVKSWRSDTIVLSSKTWETKSTTLYVSFTWFSSAKEETPRIRYPSVC